MNQPFEFTFSGTAATPAIKKVFNNTDNAIRAAIQAAGVAADISGIYSIPTITTKHWIDGFFLSSSGAAKVEIGVVNAAGSTFIPLYTAYVGTGPGVQRNFEHESALFTNDNSTWFTALRITPAATATITVGGDLAIHERRE